MHYVKTEHGDIDLWDFPGGNLYGRAYSSPGYDQWVFDGTGNHFTASDLDDIANAMKRINWHNGLPPTHAGETHG